MTEPLKRSNPIEEFLFPEDRPKYDVIGHRPGGFIPTPGYEDVHRLQEANARLRAEIEALRGRVSSLETAMIEVAKATGLWDKMLENLPQNGPNS